MFFPTCRGLGSKVGSDHEFVSLNYHVTTTPAREWSYVVDGVPCPLQDMAHGRRIRSVNELKQLPLCQDAGLCGCEIVSVLLYTGPMVPPLLNLASIPCCHSSTSLLTSATYPTIKS